MSAGERGGYEYRRTCDGCGLNVVTTTRPRRGLFHWGGAANGYRKCSMPLFIERRSIGEWRRVSE